MIKFFAIVLFVLKAAYPAVVSADEATPGAAASQADYFPAIKQELARLQTAARCNDITAVCTVEARTAEDGPAREVTVRYSRVTDTVYIFIDDLLVVPRGEAPTPDLLLRLLTLNAEMVTSKLEWQKLRNAVRLSTVVSVDSNFDRRAFRSQYTALLKVATAVASELAPKSPSDDASKAAPADQQSASPL
jgi:hypothetical protein